MNRRSLALALVATALTGPALAHGMYCTRHPAACRDMREYEAKWRAREAARWAALTPERQVEELANLEAARHKEQAAFDRQQREEDALWQWRKLAAVWTAGILAGLAMVIGGPLVWLAGDRAEKRKQG